MSVLCKIMPKIDRSLKILFIMRHSGYMGNFKALINSLASRGHKVDVVYEILPKGILPSDDIITKIFEPNRNLINIRSETIPTRDDVWKGFVSISRTGRDYLRYCEDEYKDSPKLRKRAESAIPRSINLFFKTFGFKPVVQFFNGLFSLMEYLTPPAKNITQYLNRANPDLVLLTPYFGKGATQSDVVKSSRHLGIKTVLCVASWDNLTNKGLIHIKPDKVIVWNDKQKSEAVKMHGLKADDVIVTGAYNFDKWFERGPATSKTEFCSNAGLDPGKPYVIYLGSSPFIAPNEVPFVRRWIEAIRNSQDEKIKELGILIRPHPQNIAQWEGVSFEEYGNISIYPKKERSHVTSIGEDIFYDSIYHSSLVVGLNTTAMIEAGILKKPVLTIYDPEFKETQEGTLHFRYLVKGGLLFISKNLQEHCYQMSYILNNKVDVEKKLYNFIKDFVRPRGYDNSAIPIITDEISAFAGEKCYIRFKQRSFACIISALLLPLVAIMNEVSKHKHSKKIRKLSRYMLKRCLKVIRYPVKYIKYKLNGQEAVETGKKSRKQKRVYAGKKEASKKGILK